MKFFALFIYRPVATILISLAITLCGILGFRLLPVAPLPALPLFWSAGVLLHAVRVPTRARAAPRAISSFFIPNPPVFRSSPAGPAGAVRSRLAHVPDGT